MTCWPSLVWIKSMCLISVCFAAWARVRGIWLPMLHLADFTGIKLKARRSCQLWDGVLIASMKWSITQ